MAKSDAQWMENTCHIPVFVNALPWVENVELNKVL